MTGLVVVPMAVMLSVQPPLAHSQDRDSSPVRAVAERATARVESSTSTQHPRRPIGRLSVDPIELVSEESLFSFLEDLTSIRPYLGWRNSASRGEAEAIAYVEETLLGMSYLKRFELVQRGSTLTLRPQG